MKSKIVNIYKHDSVDKRCIIFIKYVEILKSQYRSWYDNICDLLVLH